MFLATPWIVDAVTTVITTSNELASLPVTQLKKMQPSSVWRTMNLTNIYLTVDCATEQAIDLIALLHTNATNGATWRIRGATSEGNLTAAPGYDSGTMDISVWKAVGAVATERETGWRSFPALKRLALEQVYRWWRIDISDPNNPDGYFQAGRLYLTKAWTPTVNLQFNWALGWQDLSIQLEALEGNVWTGERQKRRAATFTLTFLTQAEMYGNAFEIARRAGAAKDILWCKDPDDAESVLKMTVHGVMVELPPIVNPAYSIFENSFKLVELI